MNALCKCGCGREVNLNWRGKPNSFISGHNNAGRRRKQYPIRVCMECGVEFSGMPSDMMGRKYCSKECRDIYRRKHTGVEHPSYRQVDVKCVTCGKSIKVMPCKASKGLTYCSTKCGFKARSEKARLRAVGGSSFAVKSARKRDGGKCLLCKYDLVVHIHHIKPRAEGGRNALDNLITLCPNCHALVHLGKIPTSTLKEVLCKLKQKK